MNGPMSPLSPARSRLEWSWQPKDRYPLVTWFGVAGLAAASLMALFGLPPVELHSPLHHLGVMDPLCGGTRAARYTMRGEFVNAWRYNPLGIVAVAAAAAMTGRALIGALTRRWLTVAIQWSPRGRRVVVALVIIALILL